MLRPKKPLSHEFKSFMGWYVDFLGGNALVLKATVLLVETTHLAR